MFLKREQIVESRIYPFTILFDPDKEIWKKFGWNAAHLAFSLLNQDNNFLQQLLEKPESFRPESLEEMARNLSHYQITPKRGLISDLIAGTVFENEPITVNPLLLDHTFPQINELVAQLESLPPFLRTGDGWLLGGSSEYAKGLGVKLVFDSNLQRQDTHRIKKICSKAEVSIGNLQSVRQNKILTGFTELPIWR